MLKLRVINIILAVLLGFSIGYLVKRGGGTPEHPLFDSQAETGTPASLETDSAESSSELLPVDFDSPPEPENAAGLPGNVFDSDNPLAGLLRKLEKSRDKKENEDEEKKDRKAEPRKNEAEGGAQAEYEIEISGEDDLENIVDKRELFFSDPAKYKGRALTLMLQMISARREGGMWKLNMMYHGREREIHYLYLDDDSFLKKNPDLKVGYEYEVNFMCGRGKLNSGNDLISIRPTGEKAQWAGGMSAVEE